MAIKIEKSTPLEIPEGDPFKKDCFHREQYIKNLTNLISISSEATVMSIEAPWGFGKTTFVKIWQQYLINNGFLAIYFNAWENDYSNEPLGSFISSITSDIDKLDVFNEEKVTADLKKVGGAILSKGIPILLAALTHGILNGSNFDTIEKFISDGDLSKLVDESSSLAIEALIKQKEDIASFKKTLGKLTEAIDKTEKELPLVIFIDELDRCKPNFALDLLESIKHIFSVSDIFFIVSIDRESLQNSLETLYGSRFDCDGYLRRFFDFSFQLNQSSVDILDFIGAEFKKLDMLKLLQNSAPPNNPITLISDVVIEKKFSIRKLQQIISEMNIILRIVDPTANILKFPIIMVLLILFKHTNTQLYELSLEQNPEFLDILIQEYGEIILSKDLNWEYYLPLILERRRNSYSDQAEEIRMEIEIIKNQNNQEYHGLFDCIISRLYELNYKTYFNYIPAAKEYLDFYTMVIPE